ELVGEFFGYHQDELDFAVADRGFRVGGTSDDLDARLLFEPVDQNRSILPAHHWHADFERAPLLVGNAVEHEGNQSRADQAADEERVNGPAIAQRVGELFTDHDQCAREIHSAGASRPDNATNASSREDSPVSASNSSGDPSAATRPLAITMILS